MNTAANQQTTDTVLMVRPHRFYSNPETAITNAFQTPEPDDATTLALSEFDAMVAALSDAGVRVIVESDTPEPATPDAVFPNNWLSTHADGTVITYPMQPQSRRAERRQDILDGFKARHGLTVSRHLDLSTLENDGVYLEGTGSLILDRVGRRAFACFSPRTDPKGLARFCEATSYEPVGFTACDQDGVPVYHTNVMMCIGRQIIVACVESIDNDERGRVVDAFCAHHDLVPITLGQMNQFAGNMLELSTGDGEALLVMSSTAFNSLDASQRQRLEAACTLLPLDIPTIETAGGSVRCMLAEIFLPHA
ncbi:MAG: arginine deiminase-related protein [Pseudomonadota bacterium]